MKRVFFGLLVAIGLFFSISPLYGQTTGLCPPYPCPAPSANMRDSVTHEFDTLLLGSYFYDEDGDLITNHGIPITYQGDTITIHSGVIYKFHVTAGCVYGWNTDVNRSFINDQVRTKITLFYDDFTTYAMVSPVDQGSGYTKRLHWRANYTGTVGVMVTRGETNIQPSGNECGVNDELLKLRFYKIDSNDDDKKLVWGRYSSDLYITCGDPVTIYDSGLDESVEGSSSGHSNNENGYLVVYPEDPAARLKMWGNCTLNDGDTLFVYDGIYNTSTATFRRFFTGNDIVEADSGFFLSGTAGEPMTLRINTDSSCVALGISFQVTCCINPGLPTNLEGAMINDTTAIINWDEASGNDVQYNWTLFSGDGTLITHDSTMNTSDIIYGLTCNTDYYFIITVHSNCSNENLGDTVRSEIFNYPYLVSLASSSYNVCYGQIASIDFSFSDNVNVGSTLSWNSDVGFQDTIFHTTGHEGDHFNTDSITQNTRICLEAVSSGGCIADSCITIYEHNLPAIDIRPNGTVQDTNRYVICAGDYVLLSAFGGNTYQWSSNTGYTNGNPISVNPQHDMVYTVTGTDVNQCSSTASFYVEVNPLPHLTYESSRNICLWDSTVLKATGLYQYHWERIDTLRRDSIFVSEIYYDTIPSQDTTVFRIDTIRVMDTIQIVSTNFISIANGTMDSVWVSPRINTDYRLTGTDTNGCKGSALFHVRILPFPKINQLTNNSPICLHDTAILQVEVPPNSNYLYEWWEGGSPEIVLGTTQRLVVFPEANTTYYLRVSTLTGCDTVLSTTMSVYSLPVIMANANPTHVCAGKRSYLTAIGNNIADWEWDREYNGSSYEVYPENTTTYSVIGTDYNGCTQSASVTVTIDNSPVHEIIPNDSICRGSSVTINTTGNAFRYYWYPSTGLSANSGDSVVSHPSATTDYYVVYSTINGCMDTSFFAVHVYEFPMPQISRDTTICRGDTIPLHASGGNHFLWNISESRDTNTVWVSPSDTNTYSVTVYDYINCSSSDSVKVNVIPYFNLEITASATEICKNDTIRLEASGGDYYRWNTGSSDEILVLPIDTTTVFSLRARNESTNCSVTIYDTVTVHPLPEVHIVPSDNIICRQTPVTLLANGNAVDYYWNNELHGNSITVNPTSTQMYAVTAYSNFGCENTDSLYITVNTPPADFTVGASSSRICYNSSAVITALPNPARTIRYYHWNTTQGDVNNASFTYHPTIYSSAEYVDTIRVTIEDYNGCTNSASIPVTILPIPQDTILGPDAICIYDTLHLHTAGNNHSYFWSGNPLPNNYSGSIWMVPTSEQPENLSFSVNITNDYGCSLILNKSVHINSLPRITIVHEQDTNYFCDNMNYQFRASGASHYHWNNGSTDNPIRITPTESLISVTGTDANGCKNETSLPINIIHAPTAVIDMNDTTICALQPLSIGASSSLSPVNYLWNTGSTENPLNINNLVNDTRLIVACYTEVGGVRCSQYDTVNIRVNGIPNLTVQSNTSPVCANETGTIVVSGALNYNWNPNPVLNTYSGNSVIVNPLSGNDTALYIFTVTGYNGVGCSSSLTIPFRITAPPQIEVTSDVDDNTICNGQNIFLTATGGNTYRWCKISNPDVIISHAATLTVSPTETTRYRVIGYNGASCKDTNDITVVVNPNPTVSISTNSPEICEGFSTVLYADSPGQVNTYRWSNTISSDSLTGDTITVYPLRDATYTVTATDSITGCSSIAQSNIKVNPSPVVNISIASGVCLGDSISMTAHGSIYYNWFYNDYQNIIGNGTIITVLPTETPVTTYGVIGTDSKGCKDTITMPVNVVDIPEIQLDISSPGYLCKGMHEYLGITAFGSAPDMQFQWYSFPTDTSFRNERNVAFVSPDTTTLYTVVGSYSIYGATCTTTVSQEIVIHDLPIVTASSSTDSVCIYGAVELTASGAMRYVWTSPLGTVGTDSSVIVYPDRSSFYIVVGEDSNRCVARDTVPVYLTTISPTDSVKSSTSVCYNIPTKIVLTGNNRYQWLPETDLSDFTDSSATVTLTQNRTYRVVYTNIHGCSDTLSIPITVNPVPSAVVLTPDTTICEGHSLTVRVSGGTSYVWNDGTVNDFFTVSPTEPVTYYVTVFNQYHCPTMDSVHIDVTPKFDLSIIASRDSFCIENNTIRLTANEAGDTYYWNTGSTDSIITVSPTQTTTYYLTAYNRSTHCDYTDSVIIIRNPTPDFTINSPDTAICLHDSVTLNVISNENAYYLWNDHHTEENRIVSPQTHTDYSVTATNQFGCTATRSFSLAVRPLPYVSIQTTDTATCENNTIELHAIGNGSYYQWNNGIFSENITVSQVTSTDYSVTAFSQYGCKASDTVRISIYPNPFDNTTVSRNVICPGDSVFITLSGNNYYQWSPDTSVNMINNRYFVAYPTDTTTYRIVYTNHYGCKDSTTVTIAVKPAPQLIVTPDTTICHGESVFLSATGGITYLWNTGNTNSSFTVTPTRDTAYSVIATNLYNCTTEKNIEIHVVPSFVLDIIANKDTICLGDSVMLNIYGSGDRYLWSTGSNYNHITVIPENTTVYSLWAYNNTAQCAQTTYDTVTVIPYPIINVDPRSLICKDDTVCLTASGDFVFDYNWTANPSGSIIGNASQATVCAHPIVMTTFVCTASNSFCTLTDSVEVEIASDPFITPWISSDHCGQCLGEIALNVETDFLPVTYQWVSRNDTTAFLHDLCEGDYTVTVIDALGCTSHQTFNVENLPSPEIEVVSVVPDNCGDDGQIVIAVVNHNGDVSIHWYADSLNMVEIESFNNGTTANVTTGYYWISVEDSVCAIEKKVYCPYKCENPKMWIPNSFNPYGYNRVWQPIISDFDVRDYNYELYIYNRWGELIYSSRNYDQGWNGTTSQNPNQIVQQGVYVYLIKLKLKADVNSQGKKYTGSIVLIGE